MFFSYENIDFKLFKIDEMKRMHFDPHIHKLIEIIYMLEGEMDVTVDSQKRTLSEGELAVCFPHCVHGYRSPKENKTLVLLFNLELTDSFMNTLLNYMPEDPFVSKENVHEDILTGLNTLHKRKYTEKNIMATKCFIQIILTRLFEVLKLKKVCINSDIDFSKRALLYIAQNFKDNDLSLEKMAKDLKIESSYISKVFAQKIGIKYSNYLNMQRVKYAQHQIAIESGNITKTAYESGFKSIRTFNRVFKQINDMTPLEYKNSVLLNKLPYPILL